MRDGIDRTALSTELRSLDSEARRQRMKELGQWMREASRAGGRGANVGIFLVCIAPATGFFGYKLRPEASVLILLAIMFLALGSWINLVSARRAREWRRKHPFDDWRAIS